MDVELRLPPGLFNGDSRGLVAHLGLVGRHLGGDRWAVRPRAHGKFISSQTLADETGFSHRFDLLGETTESVLIADDEEDEPDIGGENEDDPSDI